MIGSTHILLQVAVEYFTITPFGQKYTSYNQAPKLSQFACVKAKQNGDLLAQAKALLVRV
jgi:hypothetical protein